MLEFMKLSLILGQSRPSSKSRYRFGGFLALGLAEVWLVEKEGSWFFGLFLLDFGHSQERLTFFGLPGGLLKISSVSRPLGRLTFLGLPRGSLKLSSIL